MHACLNVQLIISYEILTGGSQPSSFMSPSKSVLGGTYRLPRYALQIQDTARYTKHLIVTTRITASHRLELIVVRFRKPVVCRSTLLRT